MEQIKDFNKCMYKVKMTERFVKEEKSFFCDERKGRCQKNDYGSKITAQSYKKNNEDIYLR